MADNDHTTQARVVQALAEVGRALASSRESPEFFDRLLEQACTVLGASLGMLIMVGTDERIRVTASRGLRGSVRELLPRHDHDGIAMSAITERRTRWTADVLNDPSIPISPASRSLIKTEGFRSVLAVPLVVDAGVLGVQLLCRAEVGEFSPDEIAAGEAFATLATLALEHRRFGAAEAARLRQDEALVEVERELLAELSAERLFPMILERAGVLVDARGTIYVVEPGLSSLRAAWSTSGQSTEGMAFGEGVAGVCAETRSGVLVPDYVSWPNAHARHVARGVRTVIGEPLLSRGELLGVITMNRMGPDARPFEVSDLAVLQRFARQAAFALRNATLFGQAEQRRRAAQELARLARTLSDRLDPQALGAEIVRSFRSLFPELSCTLRLLRPDGALVAAASTDFEPGHVQVPGTGLTARVLAEGHAVWSPNRLEEPGLVYDEDLRRRVEDMGLRAGLVVPLRTERGILGVLQISAHDAREFSHHEAELAQAYGDQAALTIERARLHGALRESEARYRNLYESSNDPMASTTLDGRFTSVNRAMEALLGWSRDELLGQSRDIVGTPASRKDWEERNQRILAGERLPRIWETEVRHKDGHTILLECRTRFVRDEAGRPVEIEGTYRDISARKEMEAALRQAKDAAESASRAKSSFLANMSHELRTPLNGILGYVQLLKRDGGLLAKQEKGLAVIEQSGEHLLGLINEVLDLAKIEAGGFDLQPTTFDLRKLLASIVEMMRARAEDKKLAFFAEPFTEIPTIVRTDERRLRQVLVNLLDNAIKYTREGGVAFKVGRHEHRIRFLVEDTGVGIAPEHLVRIFEAFHQIREPRAFVEGTGLGLAISRTLVTLLGGTLEVASTPGEGSRFWFDLDLPEIAGMDVDVAPSTTGVVGVRGDRRRLLVVDDKEDNRRLLRDLLAPLGFEIDEAASGEECLARLDSATPDALLLDLRMPGIDGLEVTRRIRSREKGQRMVIVAVSASAFEHHREQCLAAGADDFIAKPFRVDALLEILCRLLGLEPIYAKVEDRREPVTATAVTRQAPSADDLGALLDLARRGSVQKILEWAARPEASRYAPFADEVRRFAERFQMNQLCQFLEEIGRQP